MPQMMPMNWLMLFFMFLIIFLIFNMMNYFIFSNKIQKNEKLSKTINKKMNWKW